MRQMEAQNLKHTGRLGQIGICLGKLFRLFIYQSDWKVLPMAAIIAGLVALVVGRSTFVNMEGTQTGTFAMTCVCIWNGFFNSIQVICRERAILKREHRAGLHITSYVAAHMIYQMCLCAVQAGVTLFVCVLVKMPLPETGLLMASPVLEIYLTLFFITYASDMMALMVSAIVHTTTTAMTVMPFLLIVQLLFSGGFFSLPASLSGLTNLMISKWGMQALCISGNFNGLPSVMIWNKLVSVGGEVSLGDGKTLGNVLAVIQENGGRELILQKMAEMSQNPNYNYDLQNLLACWGFLILFSVIYAFIAVVFLEAIDKDKR